MAASVPRVGVVSADPPDAPWHSALTDGLRERGWVDGQTVAIDSRTGDEGDPRAVTDLLSKGVDVLMTVGTPATTLATPCSPQLVRDHLGVLHQVAKIVPDSTSSWSAGMSLAGQCCCRLEVTVGSLPRQT